MAFMVGVLCKVSNATSTPLKNGSAVVTTRESRMPTIQLTLKMMGEDTKGHSLGHISVWSNHFKGEGI